MLKHYKEEQTQSFSLPAELIATKHYVQQYGQWKEGERHVVAMEYMDAGSLQDILATSHHLPEDVMSATCTQILEALLPLHRVTASVCISLAADE